MFTIIVPGVEMYDEQSEEFITQGDVVLDLEHSLVSLSKWESKFNKPFLSTETKTQVETYGYIEAMILTPNYPKNFWMHLSSDNLTQINEYIEAAQSATTFGQMPERKGRGETITSELIYYWMITFNIPSEYQHWHLNRLFALIRICNVKQSKPKKMSRSEVAMRNRELNAQRRAQHGTKG